MPSRLKTIRPLVSMIKPLMGYSPGNERERDKQRRDTKPWRKWYQTARWEKLRREAFARDHYTCKRSGVLCSGRGNAPNAPVANHKIRHHGDPDLFWDIDNIETVSKAVHDSIIQSEERKAEREG